MTVACGMLCGKGCGAFCGLCEFNSDPQEYLEVYRTPMFNGGLKYIASELQKPFKI